MDQSKVILKDFTIVELNNSQKGYVFNDQIHFKGLEPILINQYDEDYRLKGGDHSSYDLKKIWSTDNYYLDFGKVKQIINGEQPDFAPIWERKEDVHIKLNLTKFYSDLNIDHKTSRSISTLEVIKCIEKNQIID